MSGRATIERPAPGEFDPYYSGYIERAAAESKGDIRALLERQSSEFRAAFDSFGETRGGHRYAAGKWSVKEVAGHIADAERVFTYRALRAARADATPLPGFDENTWVEAAGFDRRTLRELVDDLVAVRSATLALVAGLDAEAIERRGVANGKPFSVRAIVWIVAGHAAHHLHILRERYA